MTDEQLAAFKDVLQYSVDNNLCFGLARGDEVQELAALIARLEAAEAVCDVAERSEDMFEADLGHALAAWRRAAGKEGA